MNSTGAVCSSHLRSAPAAKAGLAVLLLCAAWSLSARPAFGQSYTPASPEVTDMVQKGLAHLETCSDHGEVGGNALIGLTLVRNGYDQSHPRVARAISKCVGAPAADQNNNSLALNVIFLCDLDSSKYSKTIDAYLAELFRRQAQHGVAWTYEGDVQGDTSQTQYGVLALWSAYQEGFKEPEIEQRLGVVCNWLLRTQDIRGGWGYHPTDPKVYRRLQQSEITPSTTAAGLGSVYICAQLLGLASADAEQVVAGLPPALVPVKAPRDEDVVKTTAIDVRVLQQAQVDGNRWAQANFRIDLAQWPFYNLYAQERYQSFRELAEGRKDNSPDWYNAGVEWLQKKQLKSGAWDSAGAHTVGADLATCFAILFLTRSTKKSLGLLSEGTLKGGIGLPSNSSKMALHGGRIVAADVTRSLSELVDLLEDQETTELQDLINFSSESVFSNDPAEYKAQAERLRRLASHTAYEVRMVAVRALAQTRDLDNVPVFIYALSDPDERVAREAEDGLRFVSRKLEGVGSFEAGPPSQRGTGIAKWKEWYLSIRPDAEFLNN